MKPFVFAFVVLVCGISSWVVAPQQIWAESLEFNISEKPLAEALTEFAAKTDLQLVYSGESTQGERTAGLSGRYEPEDALKILLKDSGLNYRFTNATTVILEPASGESAVASSEASVAQPAPTPSEQELTPIVAKPVVVTGELQERTVQESQTSVTIFKGEMLDQSTLFRDIKDIFNQTANVSNTLSGLGLSIRGISMVGIAGGGQGLLVNVNVDGASYITAAGSRTGAFSIWDLGQVEILRGPQSTQRGRNALAGSILVRSQDPIFEEELKVRSDYARFNEYRLAGAVNLPVSETVAVRFSGEQFYTDGYIQNPTLDNDKFAVNRMQTLRGKVRWQPNEHLDVIVGHTFSNNILGTPNVRDDLSGRAPLSFNDGPTTEGAKNNITNLRINVNIDPRWSVFSETTYLDGEYQIDVQQTFLRGIRDILDTNLIQEVRVNYQGEQVSGVLGGYYSDIDSDLDFAATFPAALFPPGSFGPLPIPPGAQVIRADGTDQKIHNYAIFGEVEMNVFSNWTFIVGGRYDYEDQETALYQATRFDPPFVSLPETTQQRDADYSAFLPKGSAIYHWTDDMSTGFTIQRGYRAGGAGTTLEGQNYSFDAEFTTNYELAFRSTWLGKRLVANANAFYTQWTDQQVNVLGPRGQLDARVENAGESEVFGFELETQWQATNHLNAYANLGHSFTRFLDFDSGGEQLRGKQFPRAPRWTGTIGGAYYFDNGFVIDANGNYSSSMFENATNLPNEESDSFFVVNGRVGYESENWSAFVFARNLFDNRYLIRRRAGMNQDGLGELRIIGIMLTGQFEGFGSLANLGS